MDMPDRNAAASDLDYLSASRDQRLFFHSRYQSGHDERAEIIASLLGSPRQISPKYFYDSKGARLFDRITEQPEYYLTRAESGIFQQYHRDIAAAVGEGHVLIEPGSGSSDKVELLLDSLKPSAYVPLEITESHLHQAARQLVSRYPWLTVHAVCADYSNGLYLPPELPNARRLLFFPGSTIGNFEPHAAHRFLTLLRQACGEDGAILIGVDLHKDADILNAAYNDSSGVTEAFNLNILEHVNRLVNGSFDPMKFRHRAFFNEEHSRVEMHLESVSNQQVTVADQTLELMEGETIHTENSYKYSLGGFKQLAESVGFRFRNSWCDDEQLFSVYLMDVA